MNKTPPGMWTHYCPEEGSIYVGNGEPCAWCGATQVFRSECQCLADIGESEPPTTGEYLKGEVLWMYHRATHESDVFWTGVAAGVFLCVVIVAIAKGLS